MPWIEELSDNPEEIYVVSNVGLSFGDYLILTPVFDALRDRYPNANIFFCTELDEEVNILAGNQDITSISSFAQFLDIYKKYDQNIFASSFDGVYQIPSIIADEAFRYKNAYKVYCEDLGIEPTSYLPKYFPSDKEREYAHDILEKNNIDIDTDKIIVIQTEASSPMRNWHYDYTYELAEMLSKDYKVVLLGAYYELLKERTADNNNITCFIKDISFRQACAVVDFASLVVGPDSVFIHVAGALNKKALALMSSFPGYARYDLMPTVKVLQKKYHCAPCFLHSVDYCGEGNKFGLKPDEKGNYISMPCMLSIKPNEVYEEAMKILV